MSLDVGIKEQHWLSNLLIKPELEDRRFIDVKGYQSLYLSGSSRIGNSESKGSVKNQKVHSYAYDEGHIY